ncbi:heparan-alpha-glucosaminide N-acetyltransferase domain-containing protein [Bounagaea algeriensis]
MNDVNAPDAASGAARTTAEPPGSSARTRPARVIGVDIARGLAVLGMFVAHFGPSRFAAGEGGAAAAVLDALSAGHAAILFATLAGVSLALLSGGRAPRDRAALRRDRVRIAVRAVALLLLGMVLTELGAPIMVILSFYGVYFLLALPLLRMPPAVLAATAAVWALLGPVISFALRSGLEQSTAGGAIAFSDVASPADAGQAVLRLLLTGTYPVLTWMPFVLAGMALGRLDLRANAVRLRVFATGAGLAVLGYGGSWLGLHVFGGVRALEPLLDLLRPLGEQTGADPLEMLTMSTFGTVPTTGGPAALLLSGPHSGTPFEILGSGGCALAVLAVCLFLGDARGAAVLSPLAATGALALSTYTAQALALIPVLGGSADAFARWPWLLLGAFTFATLLLCGLWRWLLGRGPLERVLHRVSVGVAERVPGARG